MKYKCTVPVVKNGSLAQMRSVEADSLEQAQAEFIRKFDNLVGRPSNLFQGVSDGGLARRNDHEAVRKAVSIA